MTESNIRKSTDADIKAIRQWLAQEESQEIDGNFLCNWNLTFEAHSEGELLVYVDPASGVAVAYQWGGLVQPGILQVRNDMRHRGIGRALVARRIKEARRKNTPLLFIQCTPESSIPFWRRMGFTLLQRKGDTYGYRVLSRHFKDPTDAVDLSVTIRFYPEEKKWRPDVAAISETSPAATITKDGTVHLADRVLFHERIYEHVRDVVVEIVINGKCVYCDKAKYPNAEELGVARCLNGYYLDRITLEPAKTLEFGLLELHAAAVEMRGTTRRRPLHEISMAELEAFAAEGDSPRQ
jgi:N-acetylglutamate synthase-like GNAT family acetyltransferase